MRIAITVQNVTAIIEFMYIRKQGLSMLAHATQIKTSNLIYDQNKTAVKFHGADASQMQLTSLIYRIIAQLIRKVW